jgi:ubiquinone/menaquinone biosynthesis C-methylase UbiE
MTDETRAAYDRWHAEHPVDEASDAPWHRLVKSVVAESLGSKRVLEIGCGRGGFAAWLAERPGALRPAEVVASDFSPVALGKAAELGRSRGLTNVSYQVGDLMGLAWPDASFDVVISCETIEHVPDSRRALAELARVLRPGGTLYLTFPNYLNLLGLHRLYLPFTGRTFTEAGQPINHFLVLPRVLGWVRATGLRIVHTLGQGHYLPFPGRPPVRLAFMDHFAFARPFAAHPLVIARKP